MALAEEAAQAASRRAGRLIIGYQCYDCLGYHIGRADDSQKLARIKPNGPVLPEVCPRCQKPIPEDRRYAAIESGSPTVYCSATCRRKWNKKMRRAAKTSQDSGLHQDSGLQTQ